VFKGARKLQTLSQGAKIIQYKGLLRNTKATQVFSALRKEDLGFLASLWVVIKLASGWASSNRAWRCSGAEEQGANDSGTGWRQWMRE